LDLALPGFEPGTPDFAVLTLSSECWSVLRTDNRRDIALAYLADQGLLRQGEESRDELQEILRLGNLQAMQDAVRSKGTLPVEATRLEFGRQCVLILGDSQQLSSNEELSVLNRKHLSTNEELAELDREKVGRLTEPDRRGFRWRVARWRRLTRVSPNDDGHPNASGTIASP
jgi:hypothetical protein